MSLLNSQIDASPDKARTPSNTGIYVVGVSELFVETPGEKILIYATNGRARRIYKSKKENPNLEIPNEELDSAFYCNIQQMNREHERFPREEDFLFDQDLGLVEFISSNNPEPEETKVRVTLNKTPYIVGKLRRKIVYEVEVVVRHHKI